MEYTLDTIFDIKDELWGNYKKHTPKTIKILDIHSLLCFLIVLAVKGTTFVNKGLNPYSSDSAFLMALGSMIMTGTLLSPSHPPTQHRPLHSLPSQRHAGVPLLGVLRLQHCDLLCCHHSVCITNQLSSPLSTCTLLSPCTPRLLQSFSWLVFSEQSSSCQLHARIQVQVESSWHQVSGFFGERNGWLVFMITTCEILLLPWASSQLCTARTQSPHVSRAHIP